MSTSMEWTKRDGGGWLMVHPLIGLIEIYRDVNGRCVDINGKRAWSAWRESEEMTKLTMQGKIKQWEYLNSFIKE